MIPDRQQAGCCTSPVKLTPAALRYLVLMAFCLALCSCSAGMLLQPQTAVKKNRHACSYCHTHERPQTDPELLTTEEETATLCILCHNYGSNHHPFDFTPVSNKYVNPEKGFPLFNGKVQCLTCHDPHQNADFSETPKLLRGGPYEDRREICFKCHAFREAYRNINPHQMVDENGVPRQINDRPSCLLCHAVMPDPKKDRTEDVWFRADVAFLCWRCHPPMPGHFFTEHFLKKPKRNTLATMRKSEQESLVIFPIAPRNRITCSSCHNPHQAGVIQTPAAQKGAGAPKRLRVPNQDICRACHRIKQ